MKESEGLTCSRDCRAKAGKIHLDHPGMLIDTIKYRIAGNFRGRKLSQIGENTIFTGENFHGLLAFAVPKDATPKSSRRKISRIVTKPRNSRKFSAIRYRRKISEILHYLHCLHVILCSNTNIFT